MVALPEAQLVVRIAAARTANVLSATREVAAGRLLAQAGVQAERLATVGPQPQIGASARRLHDATVDAARHPSAHLRDTTHESQIVYDAVAWMWNRRRFELAEDRARTIAR
ncbi:MAG: hypothetical protein SGJ13_11905 [Actinomycetota bacterium]|nr:hypothetical protein [Actinomycetota bacterium]